jgi:hypothetical protein
MSILKHSEDLGIGDSRGRIDRDTACPTVHRHPLVVHKPSCLGERKLWKLAETRFMDEKSHIAMYKPTRGLPTNRLVVILIDSDTDDRLFHTSDEVGLIDLVIITNKDPGSLRNDTQGSTVLRCRALVWSATDIHRGHPFGKVP